jgi:hypothetical protein
MKQELEVQTTVQGQDDFNFTQIGDETIIRWLIYGLMIG